jgi:transposase
VELRPRRETQLHSCTPAYPSCRCQAAFPAEILPDLNPIEQVFAKLKHLLRKAAPRTVEAVCAAIGELLGTFTPEECANYFSNSSYALT